MLSFHFSSVKYPNTSSPLPCFQELKYCLNSTLLHILAQLIFFPQTGPTSFCTCTSMMMCYFKSKFSTPWPQVWFSWKTSNLDGIGYWKFNIHWSSRDDCWVSTAYILNFDMTNLSSRCLSWKMSHSLPRMRVSSFLVLERIHMYFTFQMQLFWTISDGIPELDFFHHPISNNIVSIHLKPHHKDKIDFH